MVFCMDRSSCSADIILQLASAVEEAEGNLNVLVLTLSLTPQLARVYLVSDLLHNCTQNCATFWSFRLFFEWQLPEMFETLNKAYLRAA